MLVLSHFHSVIKDSGPERRTYVILSKVGDKKETVRQQQSRNAHADQHRTSHANVISQGFLLTYSQQAGSTGQIFRMLVYGKVHYQSSRNLSEETCIVTSEGSN